MRLISKSETLVEIYIKPLTYLSSEGIPHQRSYDVEAQIAEVLQFAPTVLYERIAIRDFKQPGYLQEESLVYLVRKYQEENNDELVGVLLNCLTMRISKHINGKISKFLHPYYVQECFESVLQEVTCRIIDLETDRDDYAQVRFWVWLKGIILNVSRKHLKRQCEDKRTETLSSQGDDDEEEPNELIDQSPLPDFLAMKTETYKLLDKLDPNERTAFVLRHYAEWEIQNQDPSVRTISKYFNRTPKTIRNWLNSAKEKLQKMQGEKP